MPFQFRSLTNGYLKISEKLRLQKNFLSAGIKLLHVYAFVWQENVINNPLVFDPTLNLFGAKIIKFVNRFANELNIFVYYEQNFQVRLSFFRVAGDFIFANSSRMAKRYILVTRGASYNRHMPNGMHNQQLVSWTSFTWVMRSIGSLRI